jgi:oligosaccharide repeat unit polymerase
MLIILLALFTLAAVLVGRTMLGRWFNHLTVYSMIWGSVLILVESHLIYYNSISGMAWFYILSAWLCLYLGSASVLLIRAKRPKLPATAYSGSSRPLRNVIWFFSLIAVIGLISQVQAVIREFGSVWVAVFAQGNALYHTRVDSPELGLAGASYIGTFAPAACALSGIYTARVGKLTIAGLAPLALVALSGVLTMGRATTILAIVWFGTAFLYTPRAKFKVYKWQAIVGAILAVAVLVGGISLVSGTRGLAVNDYSVSPAMERASNYAPLLPPLFFYGTGSVVGFSNYLENQDRNPHAFWGMYTFAPILRGLSHLGLDTQVPFYEENYYTPTDINVLTYLKNLHSDFGPLGVLLFPYLLGGLMTWLKLKLDEVYSPLYTVLLAHGYLIICFSSLYNTMFLGIWYSSLILGLAACWWIGKRSRLDMFPAISQVCRA